MNIAVCTETIAMEDDQIRVFRIKQHHEKDLIPIPEASDDFTRP